MPRLKLIEIQCVRTEDITGGDEAYLRVNGNVVWGPVPINDGQNRNLTVVQPVPFFGDALVELFDQDVGGIFDPDDHLGSRIINSSAMNQGQRTVSFDKPGSNFSYYLLYEVIP